MGKKHMSSTPNTNKNSRAYSVELNNIRVVPVKRLLFGAILSHPVKLKKKNEYKIKSDSNLRSNLIIFPLLSKKY